MNLQGKKINFLGDSITFGHSLQPGDIRFADLVAQKTGAIARNYGISGTRIARQHTPSENPDFDKDFPSRVAEMDPDADIVVVFGGTNDYGHGDAPLGAMTDRTKDTFYGGLHELYTRLIEKYPCGTIVILTPLHRTGEDDPCGSRKAAPVATLKTYVEIIREVAEYYSLPVLDLFRVSGLQPNVPVIQEKFVPDGLHPNAAGHQILADKVIKFLEQL